MSTSTARDAFTRKLYSLSPRGRRWANYSDLNALEYAPRLRRLSGEFARGAFGQKTPARCAAWREVMTLSPAGRDAAELYLAIAKVGLMGTIAEQEEIARHVDRLVGKCKIRKARYGLHELLEHDWLIVDPLPTGRRSERRDGRWCTCQVLQYTITPKLLSLISGAPTPASIDFPIGPDPDSREELAGDCHHQSYNDTVTTRKIGPLQKVPTIKGEELAPTKGAKLRSVEEEVTSTATWSRESVPGESVDRPTRPASPGEPDRRTSTHAYHASGAKSCDDSSAVLAKRSTQWRRLAPRTWHQGRRALLEDLAEQLRQSKHLDAGDGSQILTAAAAQSAANYRREIGAALDWPGLLYRWLELPAAERVDELRARVIPALRSWLVPLAENEDLAGRCPDPARRLTDLKFERRLVPRIAVDVLELQELRSRLPLARSYARLVSRGLVRLEDLDSMSRGLVNRCVEVFGELVGDTLPDSGIGGAGDHAGVDELPDPPPE